MTYDHSFWEALWSKTVREHADKIARRPPNAQLVAELSVETITGNRRVSITHSRMISTAPAGLLAKRAG